MLSKVLSASLIGASARESTLDSLRSGMTITPLVEGLGLMPKGCKFAVNRLKKGPEDWTTIETGESVYEDKSFDKKE